MRSSLDGVFAVVIGGFLYILYPLVEAIVERNVLR